MGFDDAVVIQVAKRPGEQSVITVNCPDKTGLGCDICRTIIEFGLRINRGDVSTDGRWCYLVYWVIPCPDVGSINWGHLKSRLLSACPSSSISFYFDSGARRASPSPVYLLKVLCIDRTGAAERCHAGSRGAGAHHSEGEGLHHAGRPSRGLLLHHRWHVRGCKSISLPYKGRLRHLLSIPCSRELLHTKQRQEETCESLRAVLGESCEVCEIQSAGPEYEIFQQSFSSLPDAVAEELFKPEQQDAENLAKLKRCTVSIDNSLSPAHTLLQIHCVDQKGLLYDILRTLKDCGIQVAYGRFMSDSKGCREVDLFVQHSDGKKMMDPEKQGTVCSRLRTEVLHPVRVMVINRGPETELLVANPVELSVKGRPRVFFDVTLALKSLGICIFSAEIGRHTAAERQWEVYRVLLSESPELSLSTSRARARVVDAVRRSLMGWS